MIKFFKSAIGFNPVRWIQNTRRMAQLVASAEPSHLRSAHALRCAVVVAPWLGTSVPWFTVAVGLLLARNGHSVTFVVDDCPFGRNFARHLFIMQCIGAVLKRLNSRHLVIRVSQVDHSRELTPEMESEAERLAVLNGVWQLRGEMAVQGRAAFVDRCRAQLRAAYPAIQELTRAAKYDFLFVPGGVWGTSGIWYSCAERSGIRFASFDSGGYGTAMLAVNGIACQLQDIPTAFALLRDQGSSAAASHAKAEAALEMDRRRAGVDAFSSQIQGSHSGDARYDGGILLALNSSWDSAALGLHTIFANNSEWIVKTVAFLLENSNSPVIVRQHPAERLEIARTSDDYRSLLSDHFGDNPRLHFIAATDHINSYAMMARVKALIVYTSTIGIEAVANSKPVITPSNSYYSNLGFVHKASSLSEYQGLLLRACSGKIHVTEAERDNALICYYLTQCCNWVFTAFNPGDFSEWSNRSIEQWNADQTVQKVLESLVSNVPIAYLNHLERIGVRPSRPESREGSREFTS